MNPIQPSRAINIKVELAGQTPKQLKKSIKGLNDEERKYLQNILKNVKQRVDSRMEARIEHKLHLYTVKSQNDPQISKMNKIVANFKGDRTSSSEVTKTVKSWVNHLSTPEIVVMTKRMNEVRKDSFGRNLRDRQFSTTGNVTASRLRTLGLKPGASLSDAIEAYKSFKSDPKESNIEAKFSALKSLHLDYDNYHADSNFEFANTKPPIPLPLPPLRYGPVSTELNDHLKLIGLDLKASSTEILDGLKQARLIHHPDKGGDEEIMKKIVDAAEPLKNLAELRKLTEAIYEEKVRQNKSSPLDVLGITPGNLASKF